MLAGRVGKALRSFRRDCWRLDSSNDFPEIVATMARLLQQLGHELQPQRPRALDRARPELRDLVEALVLIADSHGDAPLCTSSSSASPTSACTQACSASSEAPLKAIPVLTTCDHSSSVVAPPLADDWFAADMTTDDMLDVGCQTDTTADPRQLVTSASSQSQALPLVANVGSQTQALPRPRRHRCNGRATQTAPMTMTPPQQAPADDTFQEFLGKLQAQNAELLLLRAKQNEELELLRAEARAATEMMFKQLADLEARIDT